MSSALTNSVTPNVPCRRAGATVDLPAPFGPARTTTLGRRSLTRKPYARVALNETTLASFVFSRMPFSARAHVSSARRFSRS